MLQGWAGAGRERGGGGAGALGGAAFQLPRFWLQWRQPHPRPPCLPWPLVLMHPLPPHLSHLPLARPCPCPHWCCCCCCCFCHCWWCWWWWWYCPALWQARQGRRCSRGPGSGGWPHSTMQCARPRCRQPAASCRGWVRACACNKSACVCVCVSDLSACVCVCACVLVCIDKVRACTYQHGALVTGRPCPATSILRTSPQTGSGW